MIDLIKERQQEYLWEWQSKNKITLFSSKILFYLTKQHQSAHCPIHVQYVFNTQKNTYVLLIINDLSQGERMNTITSLPSRVRVYLTSLCSGCWGHPRYDDGFIFHRSEYITHNPLSHMTYHNLPLISYDPSLLMTITDDLSPIIITYALWPCLMTYDLYLMTMTYDHDFYLMTLIVTHHTWLWPITTHDFYLISPIINNHHLWPMTYPSEPSPMTYHSQLITHEYDFSPMTVIHDYHPWPLSPMTIRTVTYDHHLWPMIYDYDLWPMTMIYDLWLSLITHNCHSWLSMTMTDHMSLMTYSEPWLITYDHCSWLSRTITHDYHPWLWTVLMNITYDHQTLWLMIHHLWVSHKTVTHDYHPWLCPSHMTMPITWLTTADHDCHPWLWLSPMTMNITHNLPPLMTSLHHSWLSSLYVTYDCHRSLITRDDYLSPMTLITQDHHQWPWLPFITHDYDFLLTTSTHALSLMSYHPCLVSHVYLWPSWLMTYDLQLITRDYHIRPSFMTIIHDHQVWSLDFSPMTSHPWLLRSSQQWP